MKTRWIAVAAMVVAAGAAGWWYTRQEHQATVSQPAPIAMTPASAASAPEAPASDSAATPPPPPADPLQAAELPAALDALMGRKAVASFLRPDQFARRLVATVDNLGRSHAPSALWPIEPTQGQFSVDTAGGQSVVALDNAARYTPLVLLAETVDTPKAVALYLRMYPLLQKEYQALGYPGHEFNRRLLAVIGLLLETPEPEQPPQLQLLQVKGEVPSLRPWVHYEFADPALEALPAGQKILLRVGLVNERRLKKKLAEFRDELRRQAAR